VGGREWGVRRSWEEGVEEGREGDGSRRVGVERRGGGVEGGGGSSGWKRERGLRWRKIGRVGRRRGRE